MPHLTRRKFLTFTAAGMGAATLGSMAIDLTPEQVAAVSARRQFGTLRVAWGDSPATLDPLYASSDVEIAFLNSVYDYLLDTNENFELVPRLATDWSISDDGLTYTLTIAEGVTFHDGSVLTMDDIVWTFERLKSDGPTADLFRNVTVAGGTANTVVFTLASPNPDFLFNLSDNHAVILKANPLSVTVEYNGTGPFKLDEFAANRATFSANADYWAGAPEISALQFIYFGNVDAAVNALRGGVVDVVLRMDNATFLSLSTMGGIAAQEVPTSGHDVVRLRADRAPGDDERVRRAFRLATDRRALWEGTQFGFGTVGRDSPIGPVFANYYTEDTPLPDRDPDAARTLLAEAGYPDGLVMRLYVPRLADRVALAEELADQWAEAGIIIEIEAQDESVYYAEGGWLEVDLAITPWGPRPVPQLYCELYLKSTADWNEAHWTDDELDLNIDLAGSSLDEDARIRAYHEIQRIMIERGPIIIPYFFASFGVMASEIDGLYVNPFPGRTNFNTATFA